MQHLDIKYELKELQINVYEGTGLQIMNAVGGGLNSLNSRVPSSFSGCQKVYKRYIHASTNLLQNQIAVLATS